MSEENIEVVITSIDAYNAEDLDAQMDTYAPDAVVVFAPDFLPGAPRAPLVGREAVRSWIAQEGQYFRARYKASEVRPLGVGRILCRGGWGGIGGASGIEAYQSVSILFTIRDGLICRAEFYTDHNQALKAAGLAE